MSEAPKGPSSGELMASGAMGDHHANHASSISSGGSGMAANIGGQGLCKGMEGHGITFGAVASIDAVVAVGEGAFSSNPINDIADGTFVGQGNINAFQGMGQFNAVGDMSMQNVTIGKQTNAGPGLPGIVSHGNEGQGH